MCLFKKPKYVVIIGPQNSGKGTYSKEICKKYNIPHISTGDILRENINKGTELGKKAREYMNNGVLVPDELIFGLLKDRLSQKDAKNGALFDGFPRSLSQSKYLVDMINVSAVVDCQITDEVSVARMKNRRICNKCGKVFTVKPGEKTPKCDCGGKLVVREDDNEETLKVRLKGFHEQTQPVIDFFKTYKNKKGKNIYVSVDASKTIPEVNAEIDKKLSEIL